MGFWQFDARNLHDNRPFGGIVTVKGASKTLETTA
jgi:hypothetical protein